MFAEFVYLAEQGKAMLALEPAGNGDRAKLEIFEREIVGTQHESDEKGIRRLLIPVERKKVQRTK